MAKKQAKPGAKAPASPDGFIRFRASGPYRDWVAKLAEHHRSDMSDLIDDALVALAKAEGFGETPPRR